MNRELQLHSSKNNNKKNQSKSEFDYEKTQSYAKIYQVFIQIWEGIDLHGLS
jgi:hypothetical protein